MKIIFIIFSEIFYFFGNLFDQKNPKTTGVAVFNISTDIRVFFFKWVERLCVI